MKMERVKWIVSKIRSFLDCFSVKEGIGIFDGSEIAGSSSRKELISLLCIVVAMISSFWLQAEKRKSPYSSNRKKYGVMKNGLICKKDSYDG